MADSNVEASDNWSMNRYRSRYLISWRVMGVWWPPRSSKPLTVRLSDRGRFDSYPLRLFWLELNKDSQSHLS